MRHRLALRLRWRTLVFIAISAVIFLTYHFLRLDRHDAPERGTASYSSRHGGSRSPAGNYTKTLVVASTKAEDMTWLKGAFKDGDGIKAIVYRTDDPAAPDHTPTNKGHEVMVYLTYIIEHYDHLADVSIFLHSHRYAWHNNLLLDNDAVQVVTWLRAEYVFRQGYMNTRCHWDPGCPEWLHPSASTTNPNKPEEQVFASAWAEIFPSEPLPPVLAQPCCAQFAVSKARIHQLPRERYEEFRDWLLRTELSDYLSGRVWEYLWHYVFTGQSVVCPQEHSCYCDGFGICFVDGAEGYTKWWDKMWEKRVWEDKLKSWRFRKEATAAAQEEDRNEDLATMETPIAGEEVEFEKKIAELDAWLQLEKWKATIEGDIARGLP
jgi:hypothetical protein